MRPSLWPFYTGRNIIASESGRCCIELVSTQTDNLFSRFKLATRRNFFIANTVVLDCVIVEVPAGKKLAAVGHREVIGCAVLYCKQLVPTIAGGRKYTVAPIVSGSVGIGQAGV